MDTRTRPEQPAEQIPGFELEATDTGEGVKEVRPAKELSISKGRQMAGAVKTEMKLARLPGADDRERPAEPAEKLIKTESPTPREKGIALETGESGMMEPTGMTIKQYERRRNEASKMEIQQTLEDMTDKEVSSYLARKSAAVELSTLLKIDPQKAADWNMQADAAAEEVFNRADSSDLEKYMDIHDPKPKELLNLITRYGGPEGRDAVDDYLFVLKVLIGTEKDLADGRKKFLENPEANSAVELLPLERRVERANRLFIEKGKLLEEIKERLVVPEEEIRKLIDYLDEDGDESK